MAPMTAEGLMYADSFHLIYLFAATCGVLAIPAIIGMVAVLRERD
jgi:hypothetical protein